MMKWLVAVNNQEKVKDAKINVDLVGQMSGDDKIMDGPLEHSHVQASSLKNSEPIKIDESG